MSGVEQMSITTETKIVIIERGKGRVGLYNGYEYHYKKTYANNTTYWFCAQRKREKCVGSITVKDSSVIKMKSHLESCVQDFTKNKINLYVNGCINDAVSSLDPMPTIYKNMVSSVGSQDINLLNKVPKFSKIKTTLYDRRNKSLGLNKINFAKCSEVLVPRKYESFLLADYIDDNTRILVFCYDRDKIGQLSDFFGDATYFICSKPFKQLYSIHGDRNSTMFTTDIIPLLFALMSDRTQKSYEVLFNLVKARIPEWNPAKFTVDYESATMRALKSVFPNLSIHGCYYHFVKCIQKRADKLNLNQCPYTRRLVTLTTRLPLLPVNMIQEGWLFIKSFVKDDMMPFVKYFEKTWFKNETFVAIWNSFGNRHRTTNSLESWHATMAKEIKVKHPNIVKLLESLLRNVKFVTNTVVVQQKNKKRLQKYIDRDEFIQDTQLRLLNGELSVGHFLDVLQTL